MEQLEFFDVPSPCIGVCTVDEKGYCKGCMRNREERFTWIDMTAAKKLHVIKLCRMRYRRKLAAKKQQAVADQVEENTPQPGLFD